MRTHRTRGRRGATLLEAVVAVTLLAVVGLSGLALARSAQDLIGEAERSESGMADASNFLNSVSLWSREELDQRLGEREQGSWRLEITRSTPELYVVTLRDSLGESTVIRTGLFRAVRNDATR
jgi:hypothetical protein